MKKIHNIIIYLFDVFFTRGLKLKLNYFKISIFLSLQIL